MKVILYEDVSKVGGAGDVLNVSGGFARNFLIPRNLARPATPSNLKKWESEKELRNQRSHQDLEKAQKTAGEVEGLSLTIPALSGPEGHLFGSVTSQRIAEAMKEAGHPIDKKNVLLDAPIKTLGEFPVSIRLHPQVSVTLKVQVTNPEASQEQPIPIRGQAAAPPPASP